MRTFYQATAATAARTVYQYQATAAAGQYQATAATAARTDYQATAVGLTESDSNTGNSPLRSDTALLGGQLAKFRTILAQVRPTRQPRA